MTDDNDKKMSVEEARECELLPDYDKIFIFYTKNGKYMIAGRGFDSLEMAGICEIIKKKYLDDFFDVDEEFVEDHTDNTGYM